ncbi:MULTISPECIES: GNAT family N-acetyltransferase [unclassified Streptomyces]|uniref:GNAT family N-acetyltransferase n=1 Tax=unclassified Streptomyces TaxID=2593676 RepID=UPI0023661ABB|nr:MULTISPECIES: GNAT family N-acetyltransferase [unclassified Streptomyces]MDF3141541.1 GNAT family N-acetyltransferase [Streptomyces sp. T21Q-yed]WDF41820.1 GNAT family N-acetyltransferase [Streptomyces sp. T12]
MPPTDASANAGIAPVTDIGTATSPGAGECRIDPAVGAGADSEDTLDLHLPDELVVLFAEDAGADGERRPGPAGMATPPSFLAIGDDLLDRVADWGPVSTPAGALHLVPVRIERDLLIISRWMNDPAVAAFWGLAGPRNAIEEHLRSQLSGDGRSVPCLGMLDGTPMSYWEIYRADLDPLARYYAARPHDTGVHLLIGAVGDRGRGLGGTLLRAVADLLLDKRPACARIVAEPDIRNTSSVAAFLSAGFRYSAEVDLPAKRAALMVRDRSLRRLL